ncbi:MAG TPA: hypothetical protein VLV18_04965 [Terriglobales bacterium]|nr:hypothetical protein [Terriglobales bacterium]
MVEQVSDKKLRSVYLCELCGFGYMDLETAERCEQYCYTHAISSPKLTQKAVRKPTIQVLI